jgi:hypothetical protein
VECNPCKRLRELFEYYVGGDSMQEVEVLKVEEEVKAKLCLKLPRKAARNILIVSKKLRIPVEKSYGLMLIDPELFNDLLSVAERRLSEAEMQEIEAKVEELCSEPTE